MTYTGNQKGLLGKFSSWHIKKTHIDEYKARPFFHEREIWFSSLGKNVGYEQDGKGEDFIRPVVIVKKFNNQVFWAIPLTTRPKEGKYYFSFNIVGRGLNVAILSQIRLVDAKRLQYKIGTLEHQDFVAIKQKLKDIIS